jgi:hypothetical protein
VLVDEEMSAGEHEVTFDGSRFSSGVYFYQLSTPAGLLTRRMVLSK